MFQDFQESSSVDTGNVAFQVARTQDDPRRAGSRRTHYSSETQVLVIISCRKYDHLRKIWKYLSLFSGAVKGERVGSPISRRWDWQKNKWYDWYCKAEYGHLCGDETKKRMKVKLSISAFLGNLRPWQLSWQLSWPLPWKLLEIFVVVLHVKHLRRWLLATSTDHPHPLTEQLSRR